MNKERKHIRLRKFDYSSEGIYFITICEKDRKCLLGKIENQEIILSEIGKIADEYWHKIPEHYPHIELGEFVVMPNHVHGLLIINYDVRPCHSMAPQNFNKFGKPISGSISVIINQFKSSVKRWCNKNGQEIFQWQSRFHDHIVRDSSSHERISNYILNNPKNWDSDTFRSI